MSRHLSQLGTQFEIPISTDDDGYLGRECPQCNSYFKIVLGTGLNDITTCVCPYCGHKDEHSEFYTQAQIDYATSIVTKKVMGAVTRDLKDMAHSFNRQCSGGLISLKMDVKSSASPIQHYREKELETHVECSTCTLKYAIFGVFGFCPDCGIHNSLQILEKNLELARKEIALAEATDDTDLKEHLIGDALENAVSAFDGFGREAISTHSDDSANPKQAGNLSFQNLATADSTVQTLFGFTLQDSVNDGEWSLLVRCFQKRHVLAHKMGVIDEKYIATTDDPSATVGHKVGITSDEVKNLLDAVGTLGRGLIVSLSHSKPSE